MLGVSDRLPGGAGTHGADAAGGGVRVETLTPAFELGAPAAAGSQIAAAGGAAVSG